MELLVSQPVRAKTHDEIKPLVELCKAGKLFEVQKWTADGKPVNPPEHSGKGTRHKSPLEYAIDRGFHSLVQFLLEGGAIPHSDGPYCPMNQALENRRFDIIELLVNHGYDAKTVDMREVFASWDPHLMEYFIERGADVESNNPLAWALCARIRTALGILKRHRDKFPSFPEQANIALRHHCKEGDIKWVSILLYAGADPFERGPSSPDEEIDPEYRGPCALAYAALYGHFQIFSLKKIRIDPQQPVWQNIASYLCKDEGIKLLKSLLEKGLDPNDQENGGSSLIHHALTGIDWSTRFDSYDCLDFGESRGKDSHRAREFLKVIHLVAKHGGRWIPQSNDQINSARRALGKMKPDYTAEFVWIMAKYLACSKENVEALLRTPKMKKHVAKCQDRLDELTSKIRSGIDANSIVTS